MSGPGGGGGPPNPFSMLFQQAGGIPGLPAGFDPMQALFGGSQGGAVDPSIVQEVFGSMFEQQQQHVQQEPEPRTGPPPTSQAALRSLPRINVTTYDIVANEGSECAICLSDLEPGKSALRLPCGHLYHEQCIKEWLSKSNECPTCRFELPTDDKEYERGRESRMAGRKLRMRRADLEMKSAQELRRLAMFLRVDVKDCLEKSELVGRIADSDKVKILQVDTSFVGGSSSGASPRIQTFTASQLDATSVAEITAVMQKLGVETGGCSDKIELLTKLALSGRVAIVDDRTEESSSATGAATTAAAAACNGASPTARAGGPSPKASTSLSVGDLRGIARTNGVSIEGCLEKAEIVDKLRAAGL